MNFRRNLACLLFLVLSLPLCGQARQQYYTITQVREQGAQRWQQTYTAHGRTINVDVLIDVPQVQRFPAFRAAPQPPSSLIPEANPQAHPYYDGENTIENRPGYLQWYAGDLRVINRPPWKGTEPTFQGHTLYPPEVDWDVPYSINNEATVRSLHDKAMGVWEQAFPGAKLDLRLTEVWAGTAHRKFDWDVEAYVGPPLPTKANAYLIPKFEQLIAGIPPLAYADNSFLRFGGIPKGYTFHAFGYYPPGLWIHSRSLQAMRAEDGLQEVISFFTLQQEDIIAEDLPLCSVEQAIAAYEQLIKAGQLRLVHSLRLGYAIWEDRNRPGKYLLYPTWVAMGVMVKTPGKEAWFDKKFNSLAESRFWESNEYGPILVNAQTGELIDPWRMDVDRASDAPELIFWK